MAGRIETGYRKLARIFLMSSENECPKAEEVATISTQIKELHKTIDDLRIEIRRNTEARIYEEGVKAGKKEGIARFVSIAITAVNVVARVVSTGIVLGVLIAAGNTVGAFELIMKMFAVK